MPTIEQIMLSSPVIPVIVITDINDAVPLAQALVNGGLKVLEVTLRTELGLQAITTIKQAIPEAVVGAGTVITPVDVEKSGAAGDRCAGGKSYGAAAGGFRGAGQWHPDRAEKAGRAAYRSGSQAIRQAAQF